MVPLATCVRSMLPLAMSVKPIFPDHIWAIVVATVILAAALVARHQLPVLLALGLLLVPN